MAITADQERRLLNHYGISSLHPDRWPRAADNSSDDSSDDEAEQQRQTQQVQQTAQPSPRPSRQRASLTANGSKYRSIDRHASIRSANSLGPDSVVQKDEADPLGMRPSVVGELRRRGLPVEEDMKLRNRFMLSSTTFSPALFLDQVHQDSSTEDLLRGLEHLGRSIEQKSASLKVLVESNFERFVRAQAVINNVYTEMRNQGADTSEAPQTPGRRPHSRHVSRNSTHFRGASGTFGTNANTPVDKKKNALRKESEYGVSGIKGPLQDLTIRAEEVWGPALGGREKQETVKSVLGAMDQHREVFRTGGSMMEAIRKNDYDTVVEEWKRANRHANQAREIADVAKQNNITLSDQDAQQIIVTAKMWHDVSGQIETFKRNVWRRLKDSHARKPVGVTDESDREEHLELMGVLLQVGVDDNPIWQWLNSWYLYLKDRIARNFERSRIELEILRRRLGARESQDVKSLAANLRSAAQTFSSGGGRGRDAPHESDTAEIIAFWERMIAGLTALLSNRGILGEVQEFWETAQSFIDNKAQKQFPTAVFHAGIEHMELEPQEVTNLREGAIELVNQIKDSIMAFFVDAPVEDLSELYSPIPPTPVSSDPVGGGLTPTVARSFNFDPSNVPPPSPKRGDSWEKFAFWAPHSNSLSGSYYLARALTLVGTASSDLASLSVIRQSRGSADNFKSLVNAVRERCVQAVCAAWVTDAERCKHLEDWTRSPDRRDLTYFPVRFSAVQEKVLSNFQRIAYISDGSGSTEIITPPPAKLLQAIRGTFVTSLYKALSGMVENAEKTSADAGNETDPDGVTRPAGSAIGSDVGEEKVDASNKVMQSFNCLIYND